MTELPEIPDILTRVNREKFDRRVKLFTTLAMYILLTVMIWAGYNQYLKQQEIGTNYCYACGYYEGKECRAVYYEPETIANEELLEAKRRELAENNAEVGPRWMDTFANKLQDKNNYSEFQNLSLKLN